MNKNIIKLFAILMMCFLIGSVLVACGNTNAGQEIIVQDGKPGEAATIEISNDGFWVINGNKTNVKAEGKDGTDADSIRCVEHHWDPVYVEITKHTVDTIGLYLKVCVDCDGAEIIRYNHEYNVKGETVAVTCETDGYTKYECICGKVEPDADTLKRDLVETDGHKEGAKEYTKNEAGACDCLFGKPWIVSCTECGKQLDAGNDVANLSHNWPEEAYYPIKDDQGAFNPCTWAGGEIAKCTKCSCECLSPVRDNDPSAAPGHAWGEWSIKSEADGIYTLVRTCSVCSEKFEEGTQTKSITIADCKEVIDDAKCEDNGKKTYTYEYTLNSEKKSLLITTVTIPATGHIIAADSDYDVNLENWNVTITCECEDCDKEVVLTLPALADCELVKAAECDDNKNYYKATLTHNDVSIVVEFEVTANVGHNYNNYGIGAEWVVMEIGGTLYDAYWCTTCNHWIAVSVHK